MNKTIYQLQLSHAIEEKMKYLETMIRLTNNRQVEMREFNEKNTKQFNARKWAEYNGYDEDVAESIVSLPFVILEYHVGAKYIVCSFIIPTTSSNHIKYPIYGDIIKNGDTDNKWKFEVTRIENEQSFLQMLDQLIEIL